ncbi:unnamed protein product [Phyllotreta striolata]|uniref:Bardet-Biedl syndrome 4 n=1 Tax=Phyllotreta striolata TaxID=444603 RepID=A0A9N9TV11_PHYSR|nr:unnamed protein product [Phyllotreta striolata]
MISNGHVISSKTDPKNIQKTSDEFSSLKKYNWLMHLQHVTGRLQDCKSLISSEIERSKGKNEFALYKQGEILREEGKFQESLESFQSCLRLHPGNAGYLKEIGKCLYDMQRFKLSMEAYLEAEKASPNPDWQNYFYLGQCLLKLGDVNKASEYAQKAVQAGKQEACYELLIKILIMQGDYKNAVTVSNSAIEFCPDSVGMLTESGLLFLKLGQSEHAFERLSSALALEPSSTKALLAIGCIMQQHEDYDVALSKYKTAIHYRPDSMALWNNIGVCFYAKRKYVAAISCLKRALWLEPLNWKVLFNLGLCHLATVQPASAFNYSCAAVNLRPDLADPFTVLGVALLELQDPENAVKAFRMALGISSEDVYLVVNMALCCSLIGLNEEAAGLMERYSRMLEHNVTITEELASLAEQLMNKLKRRTTQNVEEGSSAENYEPRENQTENAKIQEENIDKLTDDDEN